MKQMVDACVNVHTALGDKERIVLEAELEQRVKMRRSVVSKRPLKAGHKISLEDLDAKRPGTGIPPEEMEMLIGKVLTTDVDGDVLLKTSDFQ